MAEVLSRANRQVHTHTHTHTLHLRGATQLVCCLLGALQISRQIAEGWMAMCNLAQLIITKRFRERKKKKEHREREQQLREKAADGRET